MADTFDTDSEVEYEDCISFDVQEPKMKILEVHKPVLSNIVIEDLEIVHTCEGSSSTTNKICSSTLRDNSKENKLRACEGCISSPDQVGGLEGSLNSQAIGTISSPGKCYINCLPNEILLHIFSFLSVRELCISVVPVCTTWRDLAKDKTLWTNLVFSFQHRVERERIKSLLTASPLLVSLELQSREDGGDLLLHAAASCPKLQELTVKFCDDLTERVFKSLKRNCPNIRYLNVEGSKVCSTQCYHLIAGFGQLRYLNLSHCQLLDNAGLTAIARQCNHLEYLDIDGITHIHDSSVMCLTKALSHCIKNLFLDGEHLTDASYLSLRECTLLQKLGISFCEEMTDVGLSGINGLKHLTWLKLRKGSQLTPYGLTALFQKEGLSQLAYLNLGECCLMDDSVLIALASTCPRLVHLVLHWCWEVTDAGISAVVAGCPLLRVLDLVGVVQLTGTSFTNVPTALPDLLILDLEQCNCIDETILYSIVSEKPSLRVFDYWGDPVVPPEPDDKEGVFKSWKRFRIENKCKEIKSLTEKVSP